jgi:formate dehydrogenase major subunit
MNLRDNVFPAVLGRVCTRPCEPACRHGWEGLGQPVAICFAKRSADDFAAHRKPVVLEPWFDATGKSVGVVGGGVAGLTVARQLALLGHQATVYERHRRAGGMMVQGIPSFRLPRDVVEREIRQVEACGVTIRCGVDVGGDCTLAALVAEHDAVVIAAGTYRPHTPDLPGKDLRGIRHGLYFLKAANDGKPDGVGKQVVVVGGGFTAVDCARMAKRLGAETVGMYYRRSREEMYITPGEIEDMEDEGIGFEILCIPLGYEGSHGQLEAVRFARARLGDPDASGRRQPHAIPGSEFKVAADTVLLCTGQTPDLSWIDEALRDTLVEEGRRLRRPGPHRTAHAGVFVAGDFATGAVSLIDAIGDAKACARDVDAQLMGEDRLRDILWIEDAATTGRTRELDAIERQPMPRRPVDERGMDVEVDTGFANEAARTEASRCYLCHYKFEIDNDLCIYCDRCLKVKPRENCIVRVDTLTLAEDGRITGYQRSTRSANYNLLFIDQKECIRCGACAEVCPVECISLQRVSPRTVRACDPA